MRPVNPGAAVAPLAALIAAGALLAAPGVGRAQVAPAKAAPAPAAAAQPAPAQTAPVVAAPVKAPAPPSAPRGKALAPHPDQGAGDPDTLRVDLSTTGPEARVLNLALGKSAMVELPVDARDVLVTNPAVADAVLRSRRRISVLGVSAGETDAVFFDQSGRRILTLDVRVGKDSSGLADAIGRLIPGSKVRVESVNDSLVLAGEVATAADADKIRRLAERFVAKPEQVVNLLTVTGRDQVMLQVRVVEMQRNIIKQLGFNVNALYKQGGLTQFTLGSAATYGINQALVGGGSAGAQYQQSNAAASGLNQGSAAIQAFERVGLVRTLAEPNLTAISGESAKFLAGGEYPVPTGQDNTGRVTIEFKAWAWASPRWCCRRAASPSRSPPRCPSCPPTAPSPWAPAAPTS
jgi:pilus assembly protein CpaC